MAQLLTESEIDTALANLPDWARIDNAITRTVTCATFPGAIELVSRVGDLAEAANHHPDIDIRWRTVKFELSTHSAGGLTELDVRLAGQIDAATTEG